MSAADGEPAAEPAAEAAEAREAGAAAAEEPKAAEASPKEAPAEAAGDGAAAAASSDGASPAAAAAAPAEVAEPVADYDASVWTPEQSKYGLIGLLNFWGNTKALGLEAPKPEGMNRLKLLHYPSAPEKPAEADEGERRGKGKGRGEKGAEGGQGSERRRYVPEMGHTEVIPGFRPGQWWRNCTEDRLEVIVRRDFSLTSPEVCRIQPGQYVKQHGPGEVFVTGQAQGLQRMPVKPNGWVTMDASSVGGPKYLEQVSSPTWRIIFRSGKEQGDVVVRESVELNSTEVAVLDYGEIVEQTDPLVKTEVEQIIRMPIAFRQGAGKDPKDPKRPARVNRGWVTCDASSQGGPRFFEPCVGEIRGSRQHRERDRDRDREDGDWDKSRMWKVINAGGDGDRRLAVVGRPEPYPPGRMTPATEAVISWLKEGDRLEQIGHSKKIRGYMVMPVRVLQGVTGDQDSGWVTRRVVDKTRDGPEDVWFVELRNGVEVEPRERRRGNRRHQGGDDD